MAPSIVVVKQDVLLDNIATKRMEKHLVVPLKNAPQPVIVAKEKTAETTNVSVSILRSIVVVKRDALQDKFA